MKVSEITGKEIADWLRIDYEKDGTTEFELESLKNIAIAYVCKYTSRDEKYLDENPDLIHAVMVLIQDMYDNRAFYVDNKKVNAVAQSIMDLHRILEV